MVRPYSDSGYYKKLMASGVKISEICRRIGVSGPYLRWKIREEKLLPSDMIAIRAALVQISEELRVLSQAPTIADQKN